MDELKRQEDLVSDSLAQRGQRNASLTLDRRI
jgi:hypothetical protein